MRRYTRYLIKKFQLFLKIIFKQYRGKGIFTEEQIKQSDQRNNDNMKEVSVMKSERYYASGTRKHYKNNDLSHYINFSQYLVMF